MWAVGAWVYVWVSMSVTLPWFTPRRGVCPIPGWAAMTCGCWCMWSCGRGCGFGRGCNNAHVGYLLGKADCSCFRPARTRGAHLIGQGRAFCRENAISPREGISRKMAKGAISHQGSLTTWCHTCHTGHAGPLSVSWETPLLSTGDQGNRSACLLLILPGDRHPPATVATPNVSCVSRRPLPHPGRVRQDPRAGTCRAGGGRRLPGGGRRTAHRYDTVRQCTAGADVGLAVSVGRWVAAPTAVATPCQVHPAIARRYGSSPWERTRRDRAEVFWHVRDRTACSARLHLA